MASKQGHLKGVSCVLQNCAGEGGDDSSSDSLPTGLIRAGTEQHALCARLQGRRQLEQVQWLLGQKREQSETFATCDGKLNTPWRLNSLLLLRLLILTRSSTFNTGVGQRTPWGFISTSQLLSTHTCL